MTMGCVTTISRRSEECRWHRPVGHAGDRASVFFRGAGCRWIRGLFGQNPCAIGIQPVHTRVDSGGLWWTAGALEDDASRSLRDSARCHLALGRAGREVAAGAAEDAVWGL